MDQQATPQSTPTSPTPEPTPIVPPSDPTPAPTPVAQSSLPLVPDAWPSAWGLYKYSKQAVMRNWGALLALILISFILPSIIGAFLDKNLRDIVSFVVGIPLNIALTVGYLAAVRGKKTSIGDSLKAGLDLTLCLKYLAYALLFAVIMFATMLVLIVPFFIIIPRLILAQYFLIDKKMGPIKSLSASWNATKGNVGKVWGIIGVFFAFVLLMLTIIGIPFALYFIFMYGASAVVLYEFLNRAQPVVAPADPVAAPTPADQPQAQTPPPPAPAA